MTPVGRERAEALALFAGPLGPVIFVELGWWWGQVHTGMAVGLGAFMVLACAFVTWRVWRRVPSGALRGGLMGLNVGVAVTGILYTAFLLGVGAASAWREGLHGLLLAPVTMFGWGVLLFVWLVFIPVAWAIVFPPVLWCGLLGALLGAVQGWRSGSSERAPAAPVTRDSVPFDASP